MIPVLAVMDPHEAAYALVRLFDFVDLGGGRLRFGDQTIALSAPGAAPADMLDLPFDHLALRVADATATAVDFAARGARLHAAFTPHGPRDIAEFWDHGVRFVFFEGPGGWPVEFCEKRLTPPVQPLEGHSHYGFRTPDLDALEARFAALGATRVRTHRLGDDAAPVNVRFLALGGDIIELFDEGPFAPPATAGWVGLLPR
jgi:catechol 2,3-dioxygenase-like lactoylglutathione lyase family enzyme